MYTESESLSSPRSDSGNPEVSLDLNSLRLSQLADYPWPAMADSASERARLRVRDEMARKHLSQRDVAGILDWSQARVSKNLNARVEMGVDDLAALCFAVGIPITEAVRDHGLEFCAEMTPTELRLLERIRQLPPNVVEGLMGLLSVRPNTRTEERGVTKPAPKMKKIR